MMKYFVLVMLLSASAAQAETKAQVPDQPLVPPGWLLCMNPDIARHSRACQIFVWDGPAPVLGATK